MQKSFLKALGLLACLAWSSMASAVGLGGINVTSSLGQPLRAEIELNSVERADKSTLAARLATPEIFKNAGLDYPYNLPKLKFQIETRPNGDPYIQVSTIQAVNDPFVSIMIEVNWASGRLLREYTFFLDPAGYSVEQPKAAEVKPIEPVVVEPVSAPVATTPEVAEVPAAVPELAPIVDASAPASAPAPAVVESAMAESAPVAATSAVEAEAPPVATEPLHEKVADSVNTAAASGPVLVVRGDTLSKVALQNKSPDVSLERMLVALYRANVDVFDDKNMNRLKAGKILRLPEAEEISKIKQSEAKKEVRAQVADWNAYRQKLAAAKAPVTEQAAKQEVAGKISTSISEKAPAKESAKEVLKLSKGEVPSDKAVAGAGGKTTAQDQANAKEEEAIAKAKALKESQDRTALLEKNVKDLKQLAELKNTPPPGKTDVKQPLSASAPAPAIPLAASAVVAASNVAPAKPKVVVPKEVPPPPSMIDDLLADPMMLGGGAAALLALGGLGYMLVRRSKGKGSSPDQKNDKKKSSKGKDVAANTAGRIAEPVVSSPETGDFTKGAQSNAAEGNAAGEQVDPIAEADLFLTFGRDVQAEEVLKEALNKDPNNIPVKLKLLGIYANRKDADAFSTYARQIKESGNDGAWEQAATLGRSVDPNNPMYGGDGGSAAAAPAPESAAPVVDLDIGFDGSPATAAAPSASHEFNAASTVVMEPQQVEKTNVLLSSELQAAQKSPMDFDVTGTNPGLPTGGAATNAAAPSLNLDDLVFDVTATHPQQAVSPNASAKPVDDGGMTFTLDFPSAPPVAAVSKDIGLGEINLNLGDFGGASGSADGEAKDERWHEVATKLDLAKAYQEMGDAAGAKEILEEVLRDGDEQQRASAQSLIEQLSA